MRFRDHNILFDVSVRLAVENETRFLDVLQKMLPNLPIFYWKENKEKFSDCEKLPEIYDLKLNNEHWQVKETKDVTFFLYAAYFDTRESFSSHV